MRRKLAHKCKNKKVNVAEKRPGSIPVLGEATYKALLQWVLAIHKQGLPVGREMIIHRTSEIYRYMFGSMGSVGLVSWIWCDIFMS